MVYKDDNDLSANDYDLGGEDCDLPEGEFDAYGVRSDKIPSSKRFSKLEFFAEWIDRAGCVDRNDKDDYAGPSNNKTHLGAILVRAAHKLDLGDSENYLGFRLLFEEVAGNLQNQRPLWAAWSEALVLIFEAVKYEIELPELGPVTDWQRKDIAMLKESTQLFELSAILEIVKNTILKLNLLYWKQY